MKVFEYIFNVGGNYSASINGISEATGRFDAQVKSAQSSVGKLTSALAGFNLFRETVQNISAAVDAFSQSGIALDTKMHELSAVAGVTGDGLKQIEKYARESAKAFGTDAAVAVEGYKLLLSQLSPELAKTPGALRAMGDCIQTTSKLMGNDGVAAAEVLTTAMNQYGISMDNPIRAAGEMARMMNVMAAAGQAGSAELPAIKMALQQCGAAAKDAGVSFEETNAAIQVLDKSGKKGAEGGVALRNVMLILGKTRFLPKEVQEELTAAGININDLGDKSKSLKERLLLLQPVLNDSALLSKTFGMSNVNAARALISGTESLQNFTDAVTGTTSAEEQAAIAMESFAERQARINQKFEDFKISVFQATGDLGIWVSTVMSALIPLSQLMPLIMGIGQAMVWIKNLNWAGMWGNVKGMVYSARIQFGMLNKELITGQFASNGFLVNILRATLGLVRFATVGLWNGIKALGAYVLSLVTGGAASSGFAFIASAAFKTFKTSAVSACRAVGVAIMNIPIIGWVAAAIAALVAIGMHFWKTSVKFRATLKGLGAAFVATFKGIWDLAKTVFGAIGELITAAFKLDGQGIKAALNKMKSGFSDFGSSVGKAFSDAYNAEIERSAQEKAEKDAEENPEGLVIPDGGMPAASDPTGGSLGMVTGSSGTGGGKIHSVTVNVDRLVEKFEIHTTNLTEDLSKVKDMVSGVLLSALNDVNLAVS